MASSQQKLKSIQILRCLAITLIVSFHLIGKEFDFGGESGVSIFFVLSGFVLSWAYSDKIGRGQFSTKTFVFHQLTKFYPLMTVAVLFFVFADWHAGYSVSLGKLVAKLLLINTWFCSKEMLFTYIGSTWFLCDIVVFYFLFKTMNRTLMRMRKGRLLLLSGIVLVIYFSFVAILPAYAFNWTLYSFPPFRLIDCAIGILLYRFCVSDTGEQFVREFTSVRLQVWLFAGLLMLFIGSFFLYQKVLPVNVRGVSLFWPFAVAFIFYAISVERQHPQLMGVPLMRGLAFIGDISMEIFLTHEAVVYMCNITACRLGIYYTHHVPVLLIDILAIPLFAWLTRKYFVVPLQHSRFFIRNPR